MFVRLIFIILAITFTYSVDVFAAAAASAEGAPVAPSKTMFYKVEIDAPTGPSHFYVLGTRHDKTMYTLPKQVLIDIWGAECMFSEVGNNTFAWGEELDYYPVSKTATKEGEDFGDHADGWLKLVPADKRESVRDKVLEALRDTGIDRNIHLLDPLLLVGIIASKYDKEVELTSVKEDILADSRATYLEELFPLKDTVATSMDEDIKDHFKEVGKAVFALEDNTVRKRCVKVALGHGQSNVDTVDNGVEMLMQFCNSTPEEIKEFIAKEGRDSEIAVACLERDGFFEGKNAKQDWYTNLRQQHWIEETLKLVPLAGPAVIVVGMAHLDMGWIPEVGRTGILNFFQKLKETDTPWTSGVKVRSIQRLVANPAVVDSGAEDAYHWVDETVSTEGLYLEALMGKLRAEEASLGAGAAGAGGASAVTGAGATA